MHTFVSKFRDMYVLTSAMIKSHQSDLMVQFRSDLHFQIKQGSITLFSERNSRDSAGSNNSLLAANIVGDNNF